MNLYLISQDVNNDYDTYYSAVVAAETEKKAKNIHPGDDLGYNWDNEFHSGAWVKSPDEVKAKYIGVTAESKKEGVILASFNAG